jgi:hypothetical protein
MPLSPTTARRLLELHFEESDHARVQVLSEKAQEGRLSPGEADELDEYLYIADLLAILHSKARQVLKRAGHQP